MFESLETGIGLDVILRFQEMHGGIFDALAKFLNFANEGIAYIFVLGIIYWVVNKRFGTRMFFALILISIVTFLLKEAFDRPRPYQVADTVIPLFTAGGGGLPSGHVSVPLMVWGYFALWMQKRWIIALAVVYVVLQFFGRMYAGVHYPQDVVMGLLIGGVTLFAYQRYAEMVAAWWGKQTLMLQMAVPVGLGLLSAPLLMNDKDGLSVAGLLIGAGFAVALETKYVQFQPHEQWSRRIIQFVFGALVVIGMMEGLGIAFEKIEPPSYVFIGAEADVWADELQAELGNAATDATTLCTAGDEADLSPDFMRVCDLQITPLAAILRVLRYTLVGFVALVLMPLISIQLGLMQRATTPMPTSSA